MKNVMARKRLLVVIPSETYRALADIAAQQDRLVEQQAAVILRQAVAAQEGCPSVPRA